MSKLLTSEEDIIRTNRRLKILYNKMLEFAFQSSYKGWCYHEFETKLGTRKFICTCSEFADGSELNEYFYIMGDTHIIFKIAVSNTTLVVESEIAEEDVWLAIHELENITGAIVKELNRNRG